MAFGQRGFERFLDKRARLAVRQEKMILSLAEATRQMFHNVFILNEDPPADVSDLLLMRLDPYQHRSEVEHQEEIDGRKFIVVRKVLQACNQDQRVMNVFDYSNISRWPKDYILATNAGLLALSLAGGNVPEVLLSDVMVQTPVGANRGVALDFVYDLVSIPGVEFNFGHNTNVVLR